MTDIICISAKDFLQVKKTVIAEKKIQELYNNLISSHVCFSANAAPYESPNRTHKTQRHINIKTSTETRKPVITTGDPLRKVKGLLNVVNTNNFDKINRKLQFTINDKNANDICLLLIHTACMQIFFIHVFMKLLHHAIQTTPKILETCSSFIETFFKNEHMFDIQGHASIDFADYQKEKKMVINTAVVVMEMIKNHYTKEYKVQGFVAFILDKLEHPKDDIEFDLLLSILVEVKKRGTNLKIDKIRLQIIKDKVLDSRMQFMLETLLK